MDAQITRLRALSRLLDSKFEGPFGQRFGLDGILGLIPVVGDFSTTALSFYIIVEAAKLGCSPSILLRMLGNVLFENVVDLVPVFGNVFDFYWKSNLRNLELLEEFLADPRSVKRKSRLVIYSVVLIVVLLLSLIIALGLLMFQSLMSLLGGWG
jgi:hypothetical protein